MPNHVGGIVGGGIYSLMMLPCTLLFLRWRDVENLRARDSFSGRGGAADRTLSDLLDALDEGRGEVVTLLPDNCDHFWTTIGRVFPTDSEINFSISCSS